MTIEQNKPDALDAFGRFFMETLRDHALTTHFQLVQGIKEFPLSAVMDAMTDEQREAVLQCVVMALDSGIHNFLYHLAQNADQYAEDGPEMTEEEQEAVPHVQVLVNGEDIASITDYFYACFNADNGWIAQYSAFKVAAEHFDDESFQSMSGVSLPLSTRSTDNRRVTADHLPLELLRHDKEGWNQWRQESPQVCPDLRGMDLSGCDLAGINLRGAHLSGAKLRGTNLRHAHLTDADLSMSNLTDADLSCADLKSASLIGADATHANFRNACLNRAFLFSATLREADLSNVQFVDATLNRVDLRGANLSDIRGHRVEMSSTGDAPPVFIGVPHPKADLSSANLQGASLRNANLRGALLSHACLRHVDLQEADLRNADLRGADLFAANLLSADLRGVKFSEASLIAVQFCGADMRNAKLCRANLSRAHLQGANLSKADLTEARVSEDTLAQCTRVGAVLDNLQVCDE